MYQRPYKELFEDIASHLCKDCLNQDESLNQTKFAHEIGVPQPTIQRLMKGLKKEEKQQEMSPSTHIKIADRFRLTVGQARGNESLPWETDKNYQRPMVLSYDEELMLTIWRGLDKITQKAWLNIIKKLGVKTAQKSVVSTVEQEKQAASLNRY